jgi:dTMP kinase
MLITFEGPDGCGKTTQIALLEEFLLQQGYSIYRTREPGGTHIGEEIRDVLHDPAHTAMNPRAEILLYSASRAQLVAEKIRPALAQGEIVLCDRFFDSTYAYQGYGHLGVLHTITEFATGGLKPDLTLYLEIDPEEGLKRRLKDQSAEWNRLDEMTLAFHQRVHEGYAKLIDAESDRWVVIDGMQPPDKVQRIIREIVQQRMG